MELKFSLLGSTNVSGDFLGAVDDIYDSSSISPLEIVIVLAWIVTLYLIFTGQYSI